MGLKAFDYLANALIMSARAWVWQIQPHVSAKCPDRAHYQTFPDNKALRIASVLTRAKSYLYETLRAHTSKKFFGDKLRPLC